jgi:ornithine carbamoyltransferase
MGMNISCAIPEGYRPPQPILDFAAGYGGMFSLHTDPKAAAAGADVVVTDVYTSMGQEDEKAARAAAFAGYQVNNELLKVAAPDAMVLHCLPAKKGEEIAADTFEAHSAAIFDEAENRLHAQKAVLVKLMG